MVSNPTSIGTPPWTRRALGKYAMFEGGERVSKRLGDKWVKHYSKGEG